VKASADPFAQPYTKDDYLYSWGENTIGGGYRYEAHTKAQGHLVFHDHQTGWSDYNIYIRGYNKITIMWTKIVAQIYISAYYKEVYLREMKPPITRYYWDPAPTDLIEWNGDASYNAQVPSTVTWSLGGNVYGMTFGVLYSGAPSWSWGQGSGVSGDYRYYGYFSSECLSLHGFTALLRFHIGDRSANDYYYTGKKVYVADGIKTLYIKYFRIQIIWKYYFFDLFYWALKHTYTANLHDEYNDLSYILFEPGVSPIVQ
jgi:hypothetical protein